MCVFELINSIFWLVRNWYWKQAGWFSKLWKVWFVCPKSEPTLQALSYLVSRM